jgi:hypothetical protein
MPRSSLHIAAVLTLFTCSGERSFCLHVPGNLSMAAAAPLLCAGITVYSPLRHYNLDKPGLKIGVVGLGGLGHMVRFFWGQDCVGSRVRGRGRGRRRCRCRSQF